MADGQRYETVLTERIGPVERITLNRPEKRNALRSATTCSCTTSGS